MTNSHRVVAIGLLTQRDLDMLGTGFRRAYPIDDAPCFGELLSAIDRAERDYIHARQAPPETR